MGILLQVNKPSEFRNELVRLLLQAGCNPNLPESPEPRTPLFIAVTNSDVELVDILIKGMYLFALT